MDINDELKKRNLTHYQLAKALGMVNFTTVYRWKSGMNKPSPLYEKQIKAFLEGFDNPKKIIKKQNNLVVT